jgi:hypothetical protein
MKKLVNALFTHCLAVYHQLIFRSADGVYMLDVPYVSQYPAPLSPHFTLDDLITDWRMVRLYGAKNAEELTFWCWRNCAIASVKMVLHKKGRATDKTMMEITEQARKYGGYQLAEGEKSEEGWFHHALITVLHDHGVEAQAKKWQSLYSVAKDVLAGKSVILSLWIPDRAHISADGLFGANEGASYGGHLVVATGVKTEKGKVTGIFIHDPRWLPKYRENTFISAEIFPQIFTNRTIVAEA